MRAPLASITESVVEDAALAWLEGFGYAMLHGPDIAAGDPGAESSNLNYHDVVLKRHPRGAFLAKLMAGELRITKAQELLETLK